MVNTFEADLFGEDAQGSSVTSPYLEVLLGGSACYSAQDLARSFSVPVSLVNEFWSAMGFPVVDPSDVIFTERDRAAFERWNTVIANGHIDQATGRSLLRAHSHLADRLALWQVEALVEDAVRRLGMEDTAARQYVLEHMLQGISILQDSFIHSWQRQLESLLVRTQREVAQRGAVEGSHQRFPLTRSLGFVDMVSYTSTAAIMGEKLPELIGRFEDVTRSAVTQAGGRVVKMMGDAVLFIADELSTGLDVVTTLIERLQADDQVLPVRASFVRGDVFSRSGDVFGPTVNLASRLAGIAPEGGILTDASTAAAINAEHSIAGYSVESFPMAELRGVGKVRPYLISRDFSSAQ